MRKLATFAILLAGCCCALRAAEPPADDNPVIKRIEAYSIEWSRVPPAPHHLNDMLPLLRNGSVLVMLYERPNFANLTRNELDGVPLGFAAQKAKAQNVADRLWIVTDHRIHFTPRDPTERISIEERHTTLGSLGELLGTWGDVTVE